MLILASQSPRRRDMFDRLQIKYTAVSTDADETITERLSPADYVKTLAERKARAAAAVCTSDDCIIAADTCGA